MTDTSKSFARETLDQIRTKLADTTTAAVERLSPYATYGGLATVCKDQSGDYVTYADYAALSAQLEAIHAQGYAKGLRDAAACLGHITRFEDLDAILALIPADLSPTPAQIMADPRVAALVDALDRIAHASNVYGVEANAEDQGAETLAYAHKSTCNLARAALAQLKGPKP